MTSDPQILEMADALVDRLDPALFKHISPLTKISIELAAAWALQDLIAGAAVRSPEQLAEAIIERHDNHVQMSCDHLAGVRTYPAMRAAILKQSEFLWTREIEQFQRQRGVVQ